MNSRENTRRLIAKQPVDFMGYNDKIWPDIQKKWMQEGLLSRENPDGARTPISFEEYFQCDIQECGTVNTIPFMGVREVLEQTDEWEIVKNGAGAIFKFWRYKTGTPEHIDFSMNSFDVWKNVYKPQLVNYDPKRCDFDGCRQLMERCRQQNMYSAYDSLGIWELLRGSLGDVNMFVSLLDDPDWIRDFNTTYTDLLIDHLSHIFEQVGIPAGFYLYDDLSYNKGPFCSLEVLRELFLPFYQKFFKFLHDRNMQVIFHCCGYSEPIVPLLIEAGIDALNPMEVKAGCDVVRYAEKFGDQLAFVGGLDVRILESGDRAAIRKEILRITDAMRSLKASYFFGTDHSVSPNVAFEDYQYALDFFREHSAY